MKVLEKILDFFKADKKKDDLGVNQLTNQKILDEMKAHFMTELKNESVGGRMLYPMTFHIVMNQDDFNARLQALSHVVPEIVKSFYEIIKEMSVKYPDYTPSATYWLFKFAGTQVDFVENGESKRLDVQRGQLAIISTLVTQECASSGKATKNPNVSYSCRLSNSNNGDRYNINKEALRAVDDLGGGMYRVFFDETLSGDTKRIRDMSNINEENGLATLSYDGYSFPMVDKLLHISGKNEKRGGNQFFILKEYPNVKDSHVQIKFLPSENVFVIAAFGPTRLNGRIMTVSNGANVVWHDLADKSNIFINEEVSVYFEKK